MPTEIELSESVSIDECCFLCSLSCLIGERHFPSFFTKCLCLGGFLIPPSFITCQGTLSFTAVMLALLLSVVQNLSLYRRVMGMRTCESRCLFSGSKGEVCCVEPLHAGADLKDHPITQYSLLAMASLTKV